ncbi:hypothetical protein KC640_03835, partial [Candidatus Dojkabacteria bacterium]|nr:hypothetical protein [Candidatus Dojkabacteria bacterium]
EVIPAEISIDNKLDGFVQDGNGCLIISYVYTITYNGNQPAENVTATSRFTNFYTGKFSITTITNPDGKLALNPGFDGQNDINLFAGALVLPPETTSHIYVTVTLCGYDPDVDFVNFVDIKGETQAASSSSSSSSTSTTTRRTTTTTRTPAPVPTTTSTSPGTTTTTTTTTPPPVTTSTTTTTTTTTTTSAPVDSKEDLYDSDQVTFRLAVGGAPEEVEQPPIILDIGGGKDGS